MQTPGILTAGDVHPADGYTAVGLPHREPRAAALCNALQSPDGRVHVAVLLSHTGLPEQFSRLLWSSALCSMMSIVQSYLLHTTQDALWRTHFFALDLSIGHRSNIPYQETKISHPQQSSGDFAPSQDRRAQNLDKTSKANFRIPQPDRLMTTNFQ